MSYYNEKVVRQRETCHLQNGHLGKPTPHSTGIPGCFKVSALVATVLGITPAGCTDNKAVDSAPPPVSDTAHTLTINDLNPPRAPLMLPLQNGVRTRVSQRARENCSNCSHDIPSTLHAVDFADETFDPSTGSENGLVLAPITGTIHRVPDRIWGNVVELTGRDGSVYISAHCDNYRDEAQERAFVLRGTPLCRIGNTGSSSTGTHLHFDKIQNPGTPGAYVSQGVPAYLTMVDGEAEPSVQTPDSFEDCCNGCAVVPLDRNGNPNPDCKEYVSFNRSLQGTLQTFISEIQTADPRGIQLQGDLVIDTDLSQQFSPKIVVHQAITMEIGGARIPGYIYLIHTTPSDAGQRNPFIDTAYATIWNSAEQQLENPAWHTQIHTERFINFDLWDLTNSALGTQLSLNLPFTQSVQERPNWNPQWELWETEFQINRETVEVQLAVYKQNRGFRYGRYRRANSQLSPWYLM